MKKNFTLVVSIVVLTSFVIFVFRVNTQALLIVPHSIQTEVKVSAVISTSFIIHNSGNAELNYSSAIDLLRDKTGSRFYNTGFEEFPIGTLQHQVGWYSADYISFQDDI